MASALHLHWFDSALPSHVDSVPLWAQGLTDFDSPKLAMPPSTIVAVNNALVDGLHARVRVSGIGQLDPSTHRGGAQLRPILLLDLTIPATIRASPGVNIIGQVWLLDHGMMISSRARPASRSW